MTRPQVLTRLVAIKTSVRQADYTTNSNPIQPRQKICSSTTEKSASVRQPLGPFIVTIEILRYVCGPPNEKKGFNAFCKLGLIAMEVQI